MPLPIICLGHLPQVPPHPVKAIKYFSCLTLSSCGEHECQFHIWKQTKTPKQQFLKACDLRKEVWGGRRKATKAAFRITWNRLRCTRADFKQGWAWLKIRLTAYTKSKKPQFCQEICTTGVSTICCWRQLSITGNFQVGGGSEMWTWGTELSAPTPLQQTCPQAMPCPHKNSNCMVSCLN